MDIRLKSSRNIRRILAIVAILAVVLGNLHFFPLIGANVQKEQEARNMEEVEVELDAESIRELVRGNYVLYYEATAPKQEYPEYLRELMESWSGIFDNFRFEVGYYLLTEEGDTSVNDALLQASEAMLMKNILAEKWAGKAQSESRIEKLQTSYRTYFILSYDANGALTVEDVWDSRGREDEITEMIQRNVMDTEFYAALNEGYENWLIGYGNHEDSQTAYQKTPVTDAASQMEGSTGTDDVYSEIFPENCRILYAVPNDSELIDIAYSNYSEIRYLYHIWGDSALYSGSLIVLAVVMLLLTSRFIWRKTIDYNRKGSWYLAEAAVLGIGCVIGAYDIYVNANVNYVRGLGTQSLSRSIQQVAQGTFADSAQQIFGMLEVTAFLVLIYAGWYVCLLVLRPLFSLGPKKYMQQYSLLYRIISKFSGRCAHWFGIFRDEIRHLDFSEKNMRTICKVVIINFAVLAVISCFWFFGIFVLIIYSLVLLWLIKRQYDRVETDYRSLREATSRMARGDLKYQDEKDWGIFEPLKGEIANIRTGFSKAVEEEVKSQRMKAELITNVSHDLKTPLTAITTYVELLKDPDITEEQRRSYIEILERKSLRLKVLVEDLFEVSKATSNAIRLELREVDVVNLLKQVSLEHEEGFAGKGLSIKWKLPEEKVVWKLDNQKTWRIFENLFLNIEKYAMPDSRVFVEVTREEQVRIAIKNMSAQELLVTGAEITERFARGDASRSTEGSGLGLAIAKSFTEAQGGTFEVTVDGDLFKVEICLK